MELKGKGYEKRRDELQSAIIKHIEQYVFFLGNIYSETCLFVFVVHLTLYWCRIQKDLVDSEKLQATLSDETLSMSCDLKRSLETVALLEAQLKEMNPNLDSIAEYVSDFYSLLKLLCCLICNFYAA